MANPQAENGHTDVNHETMEALYSADLSGSEFRVILFIMRKTWGWHKTGETIKTSTFVTETKLSRKAVCEAINKLVTKRLLITDRNSRKVTYKLNKDFEGWNVTKRKLGSYQMVTPMLPKGNAHKVAKRNLLKETIKRNNTKVLVASPHDKLWELEKKSEDKRNKDLQEIIDFATSKNFGLQGSEKINRRYAYNLLRKKHSDGEVLGPDRVKWLISAALASRGKPYYPNISDFKSLFYKWQDLLNKLEGEKHEQDNKTIIG